MIDKISRLFPLWAIIFAFVAYLFPEIFLYFKSDIVPLLMIVMFGMGMTLTWDNFKAVLRLPGVIVFGVFLQYLIMPISAFVIAKSFRLTPQLIAGTVLVGCSPGGTASNVMCYLGNADVALSVMLTTTNTLFAVIATPAFSYLFLHQIVPVPFWDIMISILQIVLFPVLIGTAVNTLFSKNMDKVRSIFPLVSTIAILLIISIIVALNKAMLFKVNIKTVLSVILVDCLGYLLGYFIPKIFKYDIKTRRTIAIEVGMQNSGLSVALAIKYFSSIAALPGAVFSVWQNISASLLAGRWRNSDKKRIIHY